MNQRHSLKFYDKKKQKQENIYEFYDSDKEAGTESHFTCLKEE